MVVLDLPAVVECKLKTSSGDWESVLIVGKYEDRYFGYFKQQPQAGFQLFDSTTLFTLAEYEQLIASVG